MKKNHIKVLLTLIGSFGASNLVFAASTTSTTSIKVEVTDISKECNKDNYKKYINEAVFYERDKGCVLTRADLKEGVYGAYLYRANLSGANLVGANLKWADLDGANLYRANLSGANLHRANLTEANLSGANLSEANLSEAELDGTDLRGADLSGADLIWAILSETDLRGADLLEVNNLDKASITGIKCDENTVFPEDFLPLSKHSIQCENSAEKTSE